MVTLNHCKSVHLRLRLISASMAFLHEPIVLIDFGHNQLQLLFCSVFHVRRHDCFFEKQLLFVPVLEYLDFSHVLVVEHFVVHVHFLDRWRRLDFAAWNRPLEFGFHELPIKAIVWLHRNSQGGPLVRHVPIPHGRPWFFLAHFSSNSSIIVYYGWFVSNPKLTVNHLKLASWEAPFSFWELWEGMNESSCFLLLNGSNHFNEFS